MVVGLMGILAAVVIVQFNNMLDTGRAESMSVTVRHIRELVELKAAMHAVPSAPSGYPATIDPAWFQCDDLPYHTWTNDPMQVEVVNAASDVVYPAVKVFDPNDATADNAWYNTTNGAFCVRVGDEGSGVEKLRAFNAANSCAATHLGQTTQ
jgi:type II secretory pathway pseudopilin PulG